MYLYASTCVLVFVSVCNCVRPRLRLFARRLSFFSIPSVSSCSSVLLFVVVVVVHTFHTPILSLSPPSLHLFHLSLSPLYLPHRLHITLHKARITQATPFHLVSSLKFKVLFFFPSLCLHYKVCILLSECFVHFQLISYCIFCFDAQRVEHNFYLHC